MQNFRFPEQPHYPASQPEPQRQPVHEAPPPPASNNPLAVSTEIHRFMIIYCFIGP